MRLNRLYLFRGVRDDMCWYQIYEDGDGNWRGHLVKLKNGKVKWHTPKPHRACIRRHLPD